MKCQLEPLSKYVYAVIYEGDEDNIYDITQEKWHNATFLHDFFNQEENISDLAVFLGCTIDKRKKRQAIDDSLDDADYIDSIIDNDELDELNEFFHLLNNEESELTGPPLKREKGKGERRNRHNSWMRLYAIRISDDPSDLKSPKIYIITGGSIKLTQDMRDRGHTKAELQRINDVRNFLQSKGVTDIDSFEDYINEEQ